MQVKVKFREDERNINVESESRVGDVLDEARINKETVIVKRDGKVIPPEEDVNDGDYLELIRIISGG